MVKRNALIVSSIVAIGAASIALARQDTQAVIGNVFLQDITPGTVQNGNFSVKGTGVMGKIRIGTTISGGSLIRVEDPTSVGGGYFRSQGNGVYGANLATTGLGIGGSFASSSTGGRGVYGDALAATGTTRGGLFRSQSTAGVGVYGLASAATGSTAGIVGEATSPNGIGIKGIAMGSTNSTTYAVQGITNSGLGAAVYGKNTASGASGTGVFAEGVTGTYGVGTNFGAIGVCNDPYTGDVQAGAYGFSASNTTSRGVYGQAYAGMGATAYGVFGEAYGTGTKWGLYSNSNMGVIGTKSFEIDHPLDPEHKTLRHYCTEGAKPLLIYQGEVQLDASGRATVKVADYVQAIGKDFSYQLTPVGASMPSLFVTKRFANGAFGLGGGAPNGSVSWTLTATRNDRWVQEHGAPVEVEKTGALAGKYLRPELYGKPASAGAFPPTAESRATK